MLVCNKYKDFNVVNGVYIGRGSVLGNPFVIGKHGDRCDVVDMYEKYLIDSIINDNLNVQKALMDLSTSNNLVCFCKPKKCHGQIIKKYFNILHSSGIKKFKNQYTNTDTDLLLNISKTTDDILGKKLYTIYNDSVLDLKHLSSSNDFYNSLYKRIRNEIINSELLQDFIDNNNFNLIVSKEKYHTKIINYWIARLFSNLRLDLGNYKKVIIAGSRSINNYKIIEEAILKSTFKIGRIVSGGANGVDKLGEKFAKENGIEVTVFLPYWDELGRIAGMVRNKEMFNYADCLIAIWDGNSSGTKNMINLFKRNNKEYYIYQI